MHRREVRRYCLACSKETGVLVERIAPAIEKRRAKAAEAQREKAERKRARAARKRSEAVARHIHDGVDMQAEYARLQCLPVWRRWGVESAITAVALRLRRRSRPGTSGHGKTDSGEIVVTAGQDPWYKVSEVILHELVHHAHDALGYHRRGKGTKDIVHGSTFHDLLRVAACAAYDIRSVDIIPAYERHGGASQAYSMDQAVCEVLAQHYGPPGAADAAPA